MWRGLVQILVFSKTCAMPREYVIVLENMSHATRKGGGKSLLRVLLVVQIQLREWGKQKKCGFKKG